MTMEVPRDIVMFSTADWHWPYWTNKQHTALRLAERGFRVLYVESVGFRAPRLNAVDFSRIAARIRASRNQTEVRRNVWVLSPLTIPGGPRLAAVRAFNSAQLRNGIKRWLSRGCGKPPMFWTYHPFMIDLIDGLRPTCIAYHCVDDVSAIPGVDTVTYQREERRLLQRCDHVFATSQILVERCANIAAGKTHYSGNVADVEHFAAARLAGDVPAELAAISRPRLAYVGVLSDFKIDLDLVASIATRRPDWSIVFVGDEREGQASPAISALRRMPNVHFLGWKPYATLPSYLRGVDVALLPQCINAYTRAMFPMKFFEYLSAGKPVVATPLPALEEFSAYHRVGAGVDAFVTHIDEAIADPMHGVLSLDHPVIRKHSWNVRLDGMLKIIAQRAADSVA